MINIDKELLQVIKERTKKIQKDLDKRLPDATIEGIIDALLRQQIEKMLTEKVIEFLKHKHRSFFSSLIDDLFSDNDYMNRLKLSLKERILREAEHDF